MRESLRGSHSRKSFAEWSPETPADADVKKPELVASHRTVLPFKRASSPDVEVAMAAIRIMIAEDEAIPRMGLREMLQDQGYSVVGEAADGQTAVELARTLKPDLVIMDIMMPGLDGINASEILSAERLAPVLLVTAYNDRELVERAKDAGVFAYVTKPFTEHQLVPQIELALARFREYQALYQEA